MSVDQKTELTVEPWRPSSMPSSQDALLQWLSHEVQRLRATVASLVDAANQATDVAPKSPRNGLVRYAKGAWATSLAGEGLYVYKAGVWTHIV